MELRYRRDLVELMKHLGLPLVAVEIGVAEANFSVDLLNSGIEKLYSIDAWRTLPQTGDGGFPADFHEKNYKTAIERLSAFGERSIVFRGLSTEMAKEIPDNSLGLVYLDGDHSENGIRADKESFWSKLVPGGVLATHDWEDPGYGTKKVFTEFEEQNGLTIHYMAEDKPEDAGAYILKPLN